MQCQSLSDVRQRYRGCIRGRTQGLLALGQLRGRVVGARERRDAVHHHQPHAALYHRGLQALATQLAASEEVRHALL